VFAAALVAALAPGNEGNRGTQMIPHEISDGFRMLCKIRKRPIPRRADCDIEGCGFCKACRREDRLEWLRTVGR
jgi:hypothetical protein